MVSLLKSLKKVASGIGQFGSAIAGNTNLDPQERSRGGEEEESVDLHYKDECVEMGDNDKQVLESDDRAGPSGSSAQGSGSTTMSKALEKRFHKQGSDAPLYLQTKTSHRKHMSGRISPNSSSTVSFAPSATSSWSSVGSNTSNSARATVLGLNDAVVELDEYEYAGVVGRGHSSTVILLQHKVTGVHYALKIIKRKTPRSWYVESFEKELHASLDHPFICPLLHSFVTYEERCYVLPFAAGGSMRNCMRHYSTSSNYPLGKRVPYAGRMPHDLARFYIMEIVCALKYLHDRNIVYHDLKPDNILIDETGHVLLCDFGLSASKVDRLSGAGRSFRGTPKYVAPEVILGRDHGTVVDSWSLGIMIYEMYFGRAPFRGKSRRELYQKICGANLRFPKDCREDMEQETHIKVRGTRALSEASHRSEKGEKHMHRAVGSGMFDPEDDFQPSTNTSHNLYIVRDMVLKLLRRNPVNRFTVTELMEHEYFDGVDWDAVYNLKIQPPKSSALSGKSSHERDIPRTGLRRFTEEDSRV